MRLFETEQAWYDGLIQNLREVFQSLYEPVDSAWISTWRGTNQSCTATATDDERSVPSEFVLEGNYPNPFNSSTTISYTLPELAAVSIRVFDAGGREVGELVHSDHGAGRYTVSFDGDGLPSGTFFYRMEAGNRVAIGSMVLLR